MKIELDTYEEPVNISKAEETLAAFARAAGVL